MAANVKNYRVKQGNVTIDISWAGDVIYERLQGLLIEELTPVFNKMVARAKQLCPVGTITRTGRGSTQTREPGTLRDSIQSNIHVRSDKAAVLGFLEAGDDDAFYAVFQEFGPVTGKRMWKFKPFLRPAFDEYKQEAHAAIERAKARLEAE